MKRFVVVFFLGVAGCATQADMTRNSIAYYGPSCRELGLSPKTPEFANCVLKMEEMYGNPGVRVGNVWIRSPKN